jgi:hypothetical protein
MVNGTFEVANNVDFSDKSVIYTVNYAPAVGTYASVDISNPLYSRYVRYASPSNGNGNVAELVFWGVARTTDINEVKGSDSNLRLFYDRLNKQIHVAFQNTNNGTGHLSVISMDGKVIENKLFDGNDFTVSASKMKAGVYVVNIVSDNKIYNRKLVIY